jgi:hypothetical protein
MAFVLDKKQKWSDLGLRLLIWSTVAAVLFALADGLLKGPLAFRYNVSVGATLNDAAVVSMLGMWCYDLRQVAEQIMFVGVILFVGAKFFETRTIFTVGFDTLDSAKISMKGPDDDNIVWIGHRYGTRLEAETIAATIEDRLKESSVS